VVISTGSDGGARLVGCSGEKNRQSTARSSRFEGGRRSNDVVPRDLGFPLRCLARYPCLPLAERWVKRLELGGWQMPRRGPWGRGDLDRLPRRSSTTFSVAAVHSEQRLRRIWVLGVRGSTRWQMRRGLGSCN